MNHTSFRAIVVNETENHQFVRKVVEREVSSLPGETYSYKFIILH